MSANGYLVDRLTRHQLLIQRLAGGQVKESLPILKQMAREIRAALARQDLTDFQTARLLALQIDIMAITSAAGVELKELMTANMTEFAAYEAEFTQKLLQGAVTVQLAGVSTVALGAAVTSAPMTLVSGQKTIRTTFAGIFETFASGVSREVMTTVQAGITSGATNAEITRNVMSLVNTRTRAQAEAVVRTAANTTGSAARNELYKQNSDVLKGEEFSAVLDGRTTITCFPARTKVLAVGVTKSIIRAQYVGDMITIRTSGGNKLRGTPNHPVLTTRGVIPLGEIKPSDKVVTSSFREIGGIKCGDNVGVESPIGEVFDSFSKAAVFDCVGKSASATDLYGDGELCNGEITVINTDCLLRDDGVPVIGKKIIDNLFGLVECSGSLSALSRAFLAVFGRNPTDMPAQIPVSLVQEFINLALADTCLELNSAWLLSRIKELKNALSIINSFNAVDASGKPLSDAMLCQKAGDSGSCSIQSSSNTGARLSSPVTVDDIIEVSVELVSCHVYTLSVDCQELYIAEGFAVKNCASLDGKIYPVGEGPQPPMHYNCRSVRVPVVDDRFAALREGATRASYQGPVSAQTTYNSWLKRQPADFQKEVLGPERAKLFRSGEVSLDKFTDDAGRVYTLDELRAREGITLQ